MSREPSGTTVELTSTYDATKLTHKQKVHIISNASILKNENDTQSPGKRRVVALNYPAQYCRVIYS